MDAGVHLPLIDFGGEGFSYRRLAGTVDAARESGFAAISANDHFVFSAPWLDGPTALAAVAERSGGMKLVTTLALASLRGPVPLAKALSALDILSGGRVIAGVGPGSSPADYEAVGVPFEQRWPRFDEAVRLLRPLVQPGAAADSGRERRHACGAAVPAAAAAPRNPAVDRKLGLSSWLAPRRQSWRWLACLRIQHHPRGLRGGREAPQRRTRKAKQATSGFPECTGHDVDVDHRQTLRRGTRPVPGCRSPDQKGPGGASRPDLRRLGGRVRGAAVPLRARRLPASPLLASR